MESVTMAFDFKKEYKEFYMPKGTPSISLEREKAGQVLNAMHKRRKRTGAYTTLPPGYRSGEPGISLFYGTAGVAYEMLRYAFPDKIQSLF